MSLQVGQLHALLRLDDKQFHSALNQAGSAMERTSARTIALGAAMGSALVKATEAMVGGLQAAMGASVDFERTMSGVQAVSGATGAEMAGLASLALQLGKDTAFSASEAAAGLEELVKGGISIPDIMNGAARSTLNLAAAGGVDLKSAAEIASNALNTFNLSGSDMAHVADLIAGAANASAIDVNDFRLSLAASGAVAATVGMSVDDLSVAIAAMGNAGIKGSDAGTSIKTMLLGLQPVTDKQVELFKELGLVTADGGNAFFDASGKLKGMADIGQTLQTALSGLTQQQKVSTLEVMFGTDAIRAAAVFTNAGAEGFNTLAASMGKVTAEAVGAQRLNNLAGDVQQLQGSVETAAITLGMAFLPALRSVAQGATGFVNALIPVIEQVGPVLVDALSRAAATVLSLVAALANADLSSFVAQITGLVSGPLANLQSAMAEFTPTGERLGRLFGAVGEAIAGATPAVQNMTGGIQAAAEQALAAQSGLGRLAGVVNSVSGAVEGAAQSVAEYSAAGFALAAAVGGGTAALALHTAALVAQKIAAGAALVATRALEAAQWAANAAMAANPIGVVVTALAALAAALVYAYQTNEEFRASVDTAMAAVAAAVQAAWAAIQPALSAVGAAFEAVGAIFQATGGDIGATMASIAGVVLGTLGRLIGEAGAAAGQIAGAIVSGLVNGITAGIGSVGAAARNLVSGAISRMREAADSRSPSRESEALGRDIGAGLELGILASIPVAKAAADRLAGTVLGAMRDMQVNVSGLLGDIEAAFIDAGERAGRAINEAIISADRGIKETIASAARQLEEAFSNLDLNRAIRGRRDAFGEQQDEASRQRRKQREDADLAYNRDRELAKLQKQLAADLAAAQTDIEREAIRVRAQEARADVNARFAERVADLQRERQLEEDERAFRKQQEQARRAFEDALENEALQRQMARMAAERDERIKTINDALSAKRRAIEEDAADERRGLLEALKQKVADLKDQFVAKLPDLTNKAEGIVTGFLDRINGLAEGLISDFRAAMEAAESIPREIVTIHRVIEVRESDGLDPEGRRGRLDGRARGGPVTAGHPYIVGEQGPELFLPRMSGTIVPNDALKGIQSPSRVFAAEVGAPAVEGIMLGRRRMEPALRAQLAGLVQPPRLAMQPVLAGSSSGSGASALSGSARPQINQTIYGAETSEIQRQTERALRRLATDWPLA